MAKRTPKDKIDIARKVCELYETGKYTIESCCENQGISVRLWTEWEKSITEIADIYKAAKQKATEYRRGELKAACVNSLMKLCTGFNEDEITQVAEPLYNENGEQIGTRTHQVRRTKKYYPPNFNAVAFALKVLEPQTYRDSMPIQETDKQVFLIGGKEVHF